LVLTIQIQAAFDRIAMSGDELNDLHQHLKGSMRVKGKIVSWNDDKGFGFAAPVSGARQLFVHVSDFINLSRRPETGQIVSYVVSADKQGRPCGKSVLLDGDKFSRTKKPNRGVISFTIVLVFCICAGLSFHMGKIPFLVLALYIILSLITFIAYAKDKSAAKNGRWRTQESTLHILALLGGWPGAIVAQQKLRHKSKKQEFRFIFWVTVLLNIGAFVWFHTPDGANYLDAWILKVENITDSIHGVDTMKIWLLKVANWINSIR
jgi:uncharacterized membrane protein YsdA (DUF1294 family)/cold shock CspA family protein